MFWFLAHEQPQTAEGPVRLPVSLYQASDDATPPAQENTENLVLVLNMDAEGKANVPSADSTSWFVSRRLG